MITQSTTFREIFSMKEFAANQRFLIGNCEIPDFNWSLEEMERHYPDWIPSVIASGLNRLLEIIQSGIKVDYDIYDEEERQIDPSKQNTKLFYMPSKPGMPYVIICPGGAYLAVCTLKEGFSTGAILNALGYHAFILCYRTKEPGEAPEIGQLPRPQEDLAAAVKYIQNHADLFQVPVNQYAVAGYSSGGHLAASWGTESIGAPHYNLPLPQIVLLAYPALDPTLFQKDYEEIILDSMYGTQRTKKDIDLYNVNQHITEAYPPVYLWHCMDDPIIQAKTSRRMVKYLKKKKRPYIYRELSEGGHGSGPGDWFFAMSWISDAVCFWSSHK